MKVRYIIINCNKNMKINPLILTMFYTLLLISFVIVMDLTAPIDFIKIAEAKPKASGSIEESIGYKSKSLKEIESQM